MSKVQVMDHPLILHKISHILKEEVGSKEFREIVGEIALLMCYEASRDLKLRDVKIKTPICEMTGKELSGKKLAVVPILRAGLGMVDRIAGNRRLQFGGDSDVEKQGCGVGSFFMYYCGAGGYGADAFELQRPAKSRAGLRKAQLFPFFMFSLKINFRPIKCTFK